MKPSLITILKILLRENKIKIDEKELEFQIQSHPSYPSLHALTGVLDHFNIQNVVLEVPANKETLEKLPEVFIAYIKDNKTDDLVLVKNSGNKIKLIYDDKTKDLKSVEEFLNLWTGIFVAVEKDESIKAESKVKNINIANLLIFITVGVFYLIFLSFKPSLFSLIHLSLSFVGLAMSIIIIKHELGFQSKVADKFCSGNLNNVNCDDVLNSKAANFLGYFKLSDLGIVYFLSIIFSWMLIVITKASPILIVFSSILAIPFTLYSISYQYFKVKKWCLLCLSIVLTLWLQAGSLYFNGILDLQFSITIHDIVPILFSLLFTITLWSFLLPKLKKEQELIKLEIEHYKFKRNYSLFSASISRSENINTKVEGINEITFGGNDKFLQIVIVTNPLCGHCKSAHKLAESILEKWKEKVRIVIRFNVSPNNESTDYKIALRLLEIYKLEGKAKCLSAMHDIYGGMAPIGWLKKWKEASNSGYEEVLSREKEWCKNNKINFTPAILINGRFFPTEYDRSDLVYFIDDIIENVQETEMVKEEVLY